jgi:hypothetical protein
VLLRLARKVKPLLESNTHRTGHNVVSAEVSQNSRLEFQQFVLSATVSVQSSLARSAHCEQQQARLVARGNRPSGQAHSVGRELQ